MRIITDDENFAKQIMKFATFAQLFILNKTNLTDLPGAKYNSILL